MFTELLAVLWSVSREPYDERSRSNAARDRPGYPFETQSADDARPRGALEDNSVDVLPA